MFGLSSKMCVPYGDCFAKATHDAEITGDGLLCGLMARSIEREFLKMKWYQRFGCAGILGTGSAAYIGARTTKGLDNFTKE